MRLTDIVGSAVVGLALGYTLQRGGFCMNTAFRSMVFKEDRSVLRAWILVLVISVPSLLLLEQVGMVYPSRAPLRPWSAIIGGLLFGMGMVWAGGCVSGTWYRASKGMLGSLLALLGFAGGAAAAGSGALFPVVEALDQVEWTVRGDVPHLGHLLPGNPWGGRWIIGGALTVAGLLYLLRSPRPKFAVGWSWPVTGAVIGVIAVAAWILSSISGRDYGLSLVQPTNAWTLWLLTGDAEGLNWTAGMLAALPVGVFLAAWKGRDLKLRLPSPGRALNQLAGGIVMGIGAVMAGGCNIGHGITGFSSLALSSILATGATILGNWTATLLVWRLARNSHRQQTGNSPVKESI